MPNTYVALDTVTVSASSSVSFTSIPSTYTDLVIVIDGTSTTGAEMFVRFNSDSGSNYSFLQFYSDGSSVGRDIRNNQTEGRIGSIRTAQNSVICNIFNYANTTTFKTSTSRDGTGTVITNTFTNLWLSTSAINAIQIFPPTGQFNGGMVFTIYGIKAE
jgi:hypothetical protein